MKETLYRKFTIRKTQHVCLNDNRNLYEIVDWKGAVVKEATKRPLVTTLKAAKEMIDWWG